MKVRSILSLVALFALTTLSGCDWFFDPEWYEDEHEEYVEENFEPDADAQGACYWYDSDYGEYFCTCTTYAACKDTCDMFDGATGCELDEGTVCPDHFDFTWCD